MKVSIVPNTSDHEDFSEFKHAVEVRASNGELVQRWTFRTMQHAEEQRCRIEGWFRAPSERGGRVSVC